ncbi:MAG: hypothetical protein A2289_13090 [Deltaproteobacteria bacterium RIFOXYA12_FULL_58_15]|nr:MAG: hypothetical protein A2289_13090 [Deltaproteobacteria bacterium RIFOXYA12_FULL_58_15]OGR09428.1 MAG: hypothetical protein A2341_18070 [Deltaproteobacteria bacterium RIFOXYB12_FULL_58_9]
MKRLLVFSKPSRPTRHHNQRGATLIELMIGLVVMLIVVGGALAFLITQVRMQQSSAQRSQVLLDGQAALGLLQSEIGLAGMGLPRRLSIMALVSDADPCNTSLTTAYVNPKRLWTVASTVEGQITLASATPTPTASGDMEILSGQWLFVYKFSTVGDLTAGSHGHGMVKVSADRAQGAAAITVDTVNYYSAAQPKLDIDTGSLFNRSGAGAGAGSLMEANVSTFGVDCSTSNYYMYWDRAGKPRLPIASTVTALAFKFLVDDNEDGQTDDQDGDNDIDRGDLIDTPTDVATVRAIEVSFTIRSNEKDPGIDAYREQSHRELIATPNINTSSDQYVFISNVAM